MLFKCLLSDVSTFKITEKHLVLHDKPQRCELQDHFEMQLAV